MQLTWLKLFPVPGTANGRNSDAVINVLRDVDLKILYATMDPKVLRFFRIVYEKWGTRRLIVAQVGP